MKLESSFNDLNKNFFIMSQIESKLRLVIDDDKVHCESTMKRYWSTIQKMKHVVCNRWGLTVHTLASSVTGLIYGVRTQRVEDSTSESVKKVLSLQFKRPNSDIPDLRNLFLAVDRGYSDCKSLITWVVKCSGVMFGTIKRTLWAPFTFDQKKNYTSDSRVFEKSQGYRYLTTKYTLLMDNNRPISYFSAFFYRNGFGGATMLQSTDIHHRFNIWDRLELDSSENRLIDYNDVSTYFRPIDDVPDIKIQRKTLSDFLDQKVTFITTHQNVPEWFILRMFCLTASASSYSIKFLMKDDYYNNIPHWDHLKSYLSRTITNPPSIDPEDCDEMYWAQSMIENDDNWEWLRSEENIKSLRPSQRECLRESIRSVTKKTLSKKFTIHTFFMLPESERHLFGYTQAELKVQVKKLLPRNHPDILLYKEWSGR